MRDLFSGYYRPTEEEFEHLWTEGVFAFDASVLLNLYRYTESTTEEFFDLLGALDGRIWLPHQAALEYHRNRPAVILKAEDTYDSVRARIDDVADRIRDELRGVLQEGRHPLLNRDEIEGALEQALAEVAEHVGEREEEHPALLRNDPIRDGLEDLFEGSVGAPSDEDTLNDVYDEGKKRYEEDVPPGYADQEKEGRAQYGDLILWKQLLAFAANRDSPIALVTDDQKDDWWRVVRGRTIGPRPELVEEVQDEAGVLYYQYTPDGFLEYAPRYLEERVEQEAIDEVRETREEDRVRHQKMRAVGDLKLPGTMDVSGLAEAARDLARAGQLADIYEEEWRIDEQLIPQHLIVPELYKKADVSALNLKGIQEALRREAERTQRTVEILSKLRVPGIASEDVQSEPEDEED